MKNPLIWLRNIPGKTKGNIAIVIIIFVVVWFILPLIPISNGYPFASIGARILILSLLILGYTAKFSAGFFIRYKNKALPIIIDYLKRFWQVIRSGSISAWGYSKSNLIDLKDKIKQDQKKRRLKRLPWYLVLGSPQAGKKYIVKNSGLMFVKPDYLGEEAVNYINQFPDFEWWFSERALMIDTMTYNHEKDIAAWKKFVKLLKRERKNKPLNGIILALNICDLLLYSNKQRQDFLQEICAYIRDIHDNFKAIVPIYIVFNKCDQIEGFMEFFDTLSKEELSQVWGMTLPLAESSDLNFVQNFFNREYSVLVEQLRKRVMWALDAERSIRGRELINAFPQQMQLFKKPIESFIAEIFSAVRYQKALQLRGIYFTSCIQGEGSTHDFLLQAMSKKFQLVPPRFERAPRIGESYFIRSLFFEVILPEALLLGDSERRKKIRQLAYKSLLIACPLVIISAGIGMHNGSVENSNNIKQISQYIDSYQNAVSGLKEGNDSLLAILPALDQLDQAYNLYLDSDFWGLNFLFMSHTIQSDINDTLQRVLHTMFLPRIAAQLEDSLNQNIQDQNLLYATLKGYLVFNASAYTNQYSIKAPVEYKWNNTFIHKPELADKLKYYLNLSLKRPVEKLPLNQELINRMRAQLEEIIPFQRAYGLLTLRGSVSNVPDLVIRSAIGSNFDRVFKLSKSDIKIPALYTEQGYTKVFLTQYRPIANEVAQDNRDIGLSSAEQETETSSKLRLDLQHAYNKNYTQAWDDALSHIDIKSFADLKDAINVLDLLISNQSPMSRMLNLIYDNTYNVKQGDITVNSTYSGVNSYTTSSVSSVSWHHTVQVLTKLRDYLVKLQQSQDQDQASFAAAKSVIQKANSDPVQQLTIIAQKAPKPVQRWLLSLADNCWKIVVQGAHNYMNTMWQKNVMAIYNQSINDRYPINPGGYSNIAVSDFNKFYGNNGILDNYFNSYIKPFVNTKQDVWQQTEVNNHTIELPQHTVDIFAKAKKVRDDFFPNGAKQAGFTITMKPLTLDNRLASVKIIVGPQQLTYSHGPQHISTINWPLPVTQDETRAIITDFNNEQYVASASGPWSLFKLFSTGAFKPTKNAGTYLFYLHLHGFAANYRITGPSDMELFKLRNLRGFRLPSNIAYNAHIHNNRHRRA